MVGGIEPARGAALLDAYGACLTDRQREACELVFNDDWSLTEAAGALGVSRARVSALVTAAVSHLEQWEQRLHLLERESARLRLLEEMSRAVRALADPGRTQMMEWVERLWTLEGREPDV